MGSANFFGADAKKAVAEAVSTIERGSAAEVVVAVRTSSGYYRHADYLFGALVALAALAAVVYLPTEFAWETWPAEVAGTFLVGALVCAQVAPLRRLLVRRRRMNDAVALAARAAFVDFGVARTRDRSGILVFVSLFERRAEVLADIGVDPELHRAVSEDLNRAVARGDFSAFVAALRQLAAPLAKALPPRADDRDELTNEVRA